MTPKIMIWVHLSFLPGAQFDRGRVLNVLKEAFYFHLILTLKRP